MTETEIFNRISTLVSEQFNIRKDKITNDLNFKKDLDADSIDFVEFLLELENTFGADIPDKEAEKISTIGEAVNYIKSHQDPSK